MDDEAWKLLNRKAIPIFTDIKGQPKLMISEANWKQLRTNCCSTKYAAEQVLTFCHFLTNTKDDVLQVINDEMKALFLLMSHDIGWILGGLELTCKLSKPEIWWNKRSDP